MSQTVDEKVVEMRFDNKQFESGVKESLNTLGRLKSALNLDSAARSFESLDKAANSVSLDGIASGIEALQNRFSTLGIVGMRVLENITDSLMGTVSNAISFVTSKITTGGLNRAMNVENAHFQLQALLKDEEAVQAVMDNAMASVDGTAYAYDLAAKAASQFAASGLRAGEDMQTALNGIVGVAAMTNSEYEGISRIFNTVAGNGRLMGDQLLQLSSRGLNAAATLADYFREVRGQTNITEAEIRDMVSKSQISFDTFSKAMNWAFGESAFRANETFTGAFANLGSALAKIGAEFYSPLIEQNSDLVLLINSARIKINEVKKSLTFDEQKSAISGLTKATGKSTEALEKMFSTIKDQGSISSQNLLELSRNGSTVTSALVDYINGVVDGSIRSTYATKTALTELTDGMEIGREQLIEFVEEGKIDFNTFVSAMETAYGDGTALTKELSDTVLDASKAISEYLNNLDMAKPMEAFGHSANSVKNVLKGLYSVLKPIGRAFSEVFLTFSGDDVVSLTEKIENLTSKLRLNEKQSNNLHDAFSGVFNVVRLLVNGFLGLFGAATSVAKPIGSFTDLVIGLAGSLGRGLTTFTEWVRGSESLNKVYNTLSSGIRKAMTSLSDFISKFGEFIKNTYNLPIVQESIGKVTDKFKDLGSKGVEKLSSLIQEMKEFSEKALKLLPEKVQDAFKSFIEKIKKLKDAFGDMDVGSISDLFEQLGSKVKQLSEAFSSNKGLSTFVENAKNYASRLKEAFTFDELIGNINTFQDAVGRFVSWFKETVTPIFDDVSFGGLAATAGGAGIIYGVLKISESLKDVAKSLSAIPNFFNTLKATLVSYQKEIKAEAMLKIAEAIGILALSITVLSFADTEKLFQSVVALGLIAGGLIAAVGFFEKGLGSVLSATKNIYNVAEQLTKGVKWKMIGNAIKDLGITIGIVVASIVTLSVAFAKDEANLKKAVGLMGGIVASLIAIMSIMGILSNAMPAGMKSFAAGAFGVVELIGALYLIIGSLKKIFELEIPDDWELKLKIFVGLLEGIGALSLVLGLAANISGGNSAASAAGPAIALSAGLYLIVSSLKKLFDLEIPDDWKLKVIMMAGILVGLVSLVSIMSLVTSVSGGGGIGSAATVLSMCVVIGAIVGALAVLSAFPGEKMLSSAVILGVTLVALGVALSGAGKVFSPASSKAVLAMAVDIGAIVIALGVLSMISGAALLKGALALGSILLILALVFHEVGGITENLAFASILSMAVNIAAITAALYILSTQSWDGLLAAAGSLSMVLLALAGSFKIISGTEVDTNSLLSFLAGAACTIVIAIAIGLIADQPWSRILAASTALSEVLLAIAASFKIMSSIKFDLALALEFILGVVAVAAIGFILNQTAKNTSWQALLGTATAISEVLLALSAAMAVCSFAGAAAEAAIVGMLLLDVFIVDLVAIMLALGSLSEDARDFIETGGQTLMDLGNYLGQFIGNIIGGAIVSISNSLPILGSNLSSFSTNSNGFFESIKNIGSDAVSGAAHLLEIMVLLGAAELVDAFINIKNKLFGSDEGSSLGDKLKTFGDAVVDFSNTVSGNIDTDAVEASAAAGRMIASLYDNLPKENGVLQKIFGQTKGMDQFGEELKKFGAAMVEYSDTVAGKIDEKAVRASVAAADVLLTFNEKLGKVDGLYQAIFGHTKTLAEFASEITAFGTAIVEYCATVSGNGAINQAAVEASTAAGEILVAFNETLGPSAGLSLNTAIFGHGKTLSEFADEIVPFGEAMVTYSDTVKGKISKAAITASTTAAEMLVALGNSLDGKSGGVLSFFTGHDSDLEDFGKTLESFGKGLVKYSDQVKKIDTAKFGPVNTEIEKLSVVVLSSSFTTDSGLKNFGDNIKNFGEWISSYSKSVSGIDTKKLNAVTKELETLIPILASAGIIDASAISRFSSALQSMANNGIEGFVSAFENSNEKVKNSVDSTFTMVDKLIESSKPTLSKDASEVGTAIGDSLSVGIGSKNGDLISAVNQSCSIVVDGIGSKLTYSTFHPVGTSVIDALAKGIESKKPDARNKASDIATTVATSIKNNLTYDSFKTIGENVGDGLIKGMDNKKNSAYYKGIELAAKAMQGVREGTTVSSPSKEGTWIGQMVGVGLSNGINDSIPDVYDAGNNLGVASIDAIGKAVDSISKLIDEGIEDYNPVISPIVDLSYAEDGINDISSMFNDVALSKTASLANGVASDFGYTRAIQLEEANATKSLIDKIDDLISNKEPNSHTENHYNFNITSTDPKEAADEISHILQRQVERGQATWGK